MKNRFMLLNSRRLAALVCLGLGVTLFLNSGYMTLKAELAQYLIARNWHANLASGTAQKPWPWADTYVTAKLTFESLDKDRYVMVDTSGESLAFGPGFVLDGTFNQSQAGYAIAGHRDSHFEIIQNLKTNDEITLQRQDQTRIRFRVVSQSVIDSRYQGLAPADPSQLILITCYPFNGLVPGGPLRYVVTAHRQS